MILHGTIEEIRRETDYEPAENAVCGEQHLLEGNASTARRMALRHRWFELLGIVQLGF